MQNKKQQWDALDLSRITFARSSDQVSTEQQGEAIILDLGSGHYHGFNEAGNIIWNILNEPHGIDAICRKLQNQYDVEENECRQAVEKFIKSVFLEGLVVADKT